MGLRKTPQPFFNLAVSLAKAYVVHVRNRAGSGVSHSPCLLGLLVDEGNDLLDRLPGGWRRCIPGHECLAFTLIQGQLHLPTNPTVILDKAVEIRSGMRQVLGALSIDTMPPPSAEIVPPQLLQTGRVEAFAPRN
jgi:hypothetical protein